MSKARAANIAAFCAILLSGAVSAYWAFRVPIFQAPDEPAHFDYAMTIYGAHRLIRLSDGRPGWVVSPYTSYLLRAVDFQRIAWHSSMRAPNGYGSRPFFAKLDAAAPSLHGSFGPKGYLNYIVPTYPFFFYALEALWMHVVASFTSSLTAVFFAARLLCVFLLMVGLYFNYRTAMNLGVPAVTAACLTAAVGLFPLTSFVSSYVQPDNLAFTLVSAALFFAVKLRYDSSSSTYAGLGLSLGLLAVTKYQFFLTVAVPSAAFALFLLLEKRPRFARTAFRIGALLAPSILLLGVQRLYVEAGASGAPALANSGYLSSIALLGPAAVLKYLFSNSLSAFTECFSSGLCAATFWQVVGWFDTPIVVVNTPIERLIRAAASLLSMATAILVAFLAVRNGLRIAACVARNHARSGLRAALSDAMFNSYVFFAALLLTLYLMTNNSFAVEGRHWYPYVFVSLLCFVWYAPRAFRRSTGTIAATLAGVLLCYSLVASPYAIAAISSRYYGPATTDLAVTAPRAAQIGPGVAGALWSVVDARYHAVPSEVPFAFVRGTRLLASGGVFPQKNGFPTRTSVMVDGRVAIPVLNNQYHARVAEAYHDSRFGYDAFYAFVGTGRFDEGPHLISAYAQTPGASGYQRILPARLFFLTQSDGRFSAPLLRSLATIPLLKGSISAAGPCWGSATVDRGTVTTAPSALLLFSGTVTEERVWGRIQAIWFLVNSHPLPGRLTDANGSFLGTIPTDGWAPGKYAVRAYAIVDGTERMQQVAARSSFTILAGKPDTRVAARPPIGCRDPLGQLAKHNATSTEEFHGTS